MKSKLLECPGGIKDIEEFLGNNIDQEILTIDEPLESQGILDSLDTMQFIIFLEKKYKKRLSISDIESLKLYSDLLEKFRQ